MNGNEKIIDKLNFILTGELTAMDVYFLQSRMFQDWGNTKLYEQLDHEMEDEKGHAALLIERILFLEGFPDLVSRESFKVGKSIPEILTIDLDLEYQVANNLREAMALCEAEQDYVSRDILGTLLKDTEEDHIQWLETQLKLIDKMGLQNYTQSMSSSVA